MIGHRSDSTIILPGIWTSRNRRVVPPRFRHQALEEALDNIGYGFYDSRNR
jgi:hypothetical protein